MPQHRRTSRTSQSFLASLTLLFGLSACSKDNGPVPAASIDVTPSSVVLNAVGATATIAATARDANGTVLPSAQVNWTSSAVTIATVSGSGSSATVTAVARGAATITATSGNGTKQVSVQVLGVRGVSITPASAAIRVGDAQPLTATVDADAGLGTTVTWSSDNAAVATVSATGVVTGVSIGTATIKATSVADSKFSATATITIAAARNVTVSPTTATIIAGQTTPLVATVRIDAGQSTAVTWRTSAVPIASVNAAGVVTGVGAGVAIITAVSVADTTLKADVTITVAPSVRAVAISPTIASLFIATTQQFTPTVSVDGAAATTVTWRTSNATVAAISATGLATALSPGTTTITAVSTVDTTKRASATVTVNSRPITVAILQRNVQLNPGKSTTLTATVVTDPGVSGAVSWTSSANGVATITSTGVVTAVATGTTLITATSQVDVTKRDTLTVAVVPILAATWTASRLNGPLYEDIISTYSIGSASAYVVNSDGDIYAWNGTAWVVSTKGSAFSTQFTAVHGTASNNLIAVGTGGVIVRFDGTQWTRVISGTTQPLYAVYVESSTSAFAVGANGTTVRFSGGAWNVTASGSTETLNGVWSSAGTAFAVGSNGTVLRFNGTAWSKLTVPTLETLNAVSGLSPTSVVVVGSFGTALRYDGTAWSVMNANGNSGSLWSVSVGAANGGRAYIAGDDGVLQLDVSSLSKVVTPYAPRSYSVSLDVSGNVWAGGQRGAVQRGTAAGSAITWETLNLSPDLLDVWSTSSTNAFAVGEFGFVYRWNGTTWARQQTPTLQALGTVWATSATDAFAGGDAGTMLRWNGTAWTAMVLPTTSNVISLWGSGSNNVFAVTDGGEVLRYNGTAWTISVTAPAALMSVYGVSATEVYAAGESGAVLRFNGTAWTALPVPANGTIAGLWMTGVTNLLAVGADGSGTSALSYRYNGTAWAAEPLGTSRVLTSVWGPSISDLYVTGDLGTLVRYNGSSWQALPTGTTDLLWSVTGAPNGVGAAFAVGYNSTVVTGSNGSGLVASFASPVRGSLEPSAAAVRAQSLFEQSARARSRSNASIGLVGSRASASIGAAPSGASRKLRKSQRH